MPFIQMETHKPVAISKTRKDQNLIESFMPNLESGRPSKFQILSCFVYSSKTGRKGRRRAQR